MEQITKSFFSFMYWKEINTVTTLTGDDEFYYTIPGVDGWIGTPEALFEYWKNYVLA